MINSFRSGYVRFAQDICFYTNQSARELKLDVSAVTPNRAVTESPNNNHPEPVASALVTEATVTVTTLSGQSSSTQSSNRQALIDEVRANLYKEFYKEFYKESMSNEFRNLFPVRFFLDCQEIDILAEPIDNLSGKNITAVATGIGGDYAWKTPELLTRLYEKNAALVTTELIETAIDSLSKDTKIVDRRTHKVRTGNYAWEIPELLTRLYEKNPALVTTELIKTATGALSKDTKIVDAITDEVRTGNYAWKIPELPTPNP
ncbi:hypothetical protein CL648_00145 [bacterium]|nr:hypothetical protein [bacterium]